MDPGRHLGLIHCLLGPPSPHPNGISIGSAALAQLVAVINRQTNIQTHRHIDHGTSITADRIFATPAYAMRPNNISRFLLWLSLLLTATVAYAFSVAPMNMQMQLARTSVRYVG